MADTDVDMRVTPRGGIDRTPASSPAHWVLAVPHGTTPAGVLEKLDVDTAPVGVASVDGRQVRSETALESDRRVDIFPLFGGG